MQRWLLNLKGKKADCSLAALVNKEQNEATDNFNDKRQRRTAKPLNLKGKEKNEPQTSSWSERGSGLHQR
jgi:hypothetical protein